MKTPKVPAKVIVETRNTGNIGTFAFKGKTYFVLYFRDTCKWEISIMDYDSCGLRRLFYLEERPLMTVVPNPRTIRF